MLNLIPVLLSILTIALLIRVLKYENELAQWKSWNYCWEQEKKVEEQKAALILRRLKAEEEKKAIGICRLKQEKEIEVLEKWIQDHHFN